MHMKRYTMPSFWPLGKKGNKFVVTPQPGPHPKGNSIPLRVALRDVLSYAETADEAKKAIKKGEVMIDKKVVKDDKYPLGLMDVLEFPTAKKQFRVVALANGLGLEEIPAKDSSRKLCSIKRKTVVNGGKTQISLHDGRNIIVGKDSKYVPGDSLVIELPGQKILSHFQMKAGTFATIVAGKNSGASGKIKAVHERKTMMEKSGIVIQTAKGEIETLKEYVLVGEMK